MKRIIVLLTLAAVVVATTALYAGQVRAVADCGGVEGECQESQMETDGVGGWSANPDHDDGPNGYAYNAGWGYVDDWRYGGGWYANPDGGTVPRLWVCWRYTRLGTIEEQTVFASAEWVKKTYKDSGYRCSSSTGGTIGPL